MKVKLSFYVFLSLLFFSCLNKDGNIVKQPVKLNESNDLYTDLYDSDNDIEKNIEYKNNVNTSKGFVINSDTVANDNNKQFVVVTLTLEPPKYKRIISIPVNKYSLSVNLLAKQFANTISSYLIKSVKDVSYNVSIDGKIILNKLFDVSKMEKNVSAEMQQFIYEDIYKDIKKNMLKLAK